METWLTERAGPEKITGVAAYVSFGDPGPAIEAFAGKVGADPPDPPLCQNTLFQMGKVARLLGDLETCVSGQSNIIIDYATARRREEPIFDGDHREHGAMAAASAMNAQQQMRWSPRGAHLMLKVRTSVVNGTLDRDHAVAERGSAARFGERPDPPRSGRSLAR